MARLKWLIKGFVAAVSCALSAMSVSCEAPEDIKEIDRQKIIKHLEGEGIYDRNVDADELPAGKDADDIKGNYDVFGDVYRYITNERRADREQLPSIAKGDSISYMFQACIFAAGNWDASERGVYWTNRSDRIIYLRGSNSEANVDNWPTVPRRIKVGDGNILKAIDKALYAAPDGNSCKHGDEIRIYMLSDAAYGNKGNGLVPAKSTIVWELTDIQIIGQPVDEPPIDEPPIDEPPIDEPPIDEPPIVEP